MAALLISLFALGAVLFVGGISFGSWLFLTDDGMVWFRKTKWFPLWLPYAATIAGLVLEVASAVTLGVKHWN